MRAVRVNHNSKEAGHKIKQGAKMLSTDEGNGRVGRQFYVGITLQVTPFIL